jgi:hypothetical protein
MIQTILYIYLSVAGIHLFATGLCLLEEGIEGIDNFWDWVIYNVFWIIHPIRALIKFIKNII